ncbi:MAG TPA: SRPBCC domain-containing protein, partial [Bacteroidia bacterium]|nr:SRPBCC domain-containing protein [Bacteroidia bacterium]
MNKTIKHTFTFKHPAKEVWKYITQAELMAEWLMKNDFKPVVGHKFMFKSRAVPELNYDGNVHCEVLEIVPLKKLVYSWQSGDMDGKINFESVV